MCCKRYFSSARPSGLDALLHQKKRGQENSRAVVSEKTKITLSNDKMKFFNNEYK